MALGYGVSKELSFCRVAERGDADMGENSFIRGELKPDIECITGDADFGGCGGPCGSRVGPTGGLDSDDCCPPECERSGTKLIRLLEARSP